MTPLQPICCVAGKSGGHILPCLHFAKKQFPTSITSLVFISTTAALDKKIVSLFPEITNHLELAMENVPYRKWWKLPLFIFSFAKALVKSFWYLRNHQPKCVISTGGFVALPVCIAAKLLRIPIYLFELNVVPGKAVSILAKIATTVFICFNETQAFFKHPCILTPYPLRFSLADTTLTAQEARTQIHFSSTKKTLLILGGSQGSLFLNNLIQRIPIDLLARYQIIHQTGLDHINECTDFYNDHAIPAQVFAYRDNLAVYYQAADLIICRAGAGTLFEALFFKKPSIVIPLETQITDHQLENGYAMQNNYPHLFSVLRQADITAHPTVFFEKLSKV